MKCERYSIYTVRIKSIFLLLALAVIFSCGQICDVYAADIRDVPPEDVTVVASFEELYNGISKQILEHKEVAYYDTNLKFDNISEGFMLHYNEKDPMMSGMYAVYFVSEWESTMWQSTRPVFSKNYNYRYEVRPKFKCPKNEMDDYLAQMKVLATELKKPTEYESVKAVHDYVVESVTYDWTLNNHLDLEGFRDGTMVCSGYSMAMFNLLTNMGLECRIVTGTADSKAGAEDHAWNVVRVDGSWYNLDATWDDLDSRITPYYYKYFLKSDKDFPNHTRESRFEGYTNHISSVSYPEPLNEKAIDFFAWHTHDDSTGNIMTLVLVGVAFFAAVVGRLRKNRNTNYKVYEEDDYE